MIVNPKFLIKMVLKGMKKNIRTLIPFLASSSLMIMVFYIMDSIIRGGIRGDDGKLLFYGADFIALFLSIGKGIVLLFSVVFIMYANKFLMLSRKKEMGLYGILGMSKKNIAVILFTETVINALIAIGTALVVGTFLNKLMLLFMYKLVEQPPTNGMLFSFNSLLFTNIFYGIIFLICFIYNIITINFGKPTDLLKSESLGEKEPKIKYLSLIVGIISLVIGYVQALSAGNVFTAISVLFSSILFVSIGTYCLFIAGSIFILKVLKNNKKFYYSTRNFISVSNLMFRMKHNAVGLASICILSTAVIILITCSASLVLLGNYNINKMCPYDVDITLNIDDNYNKDECLSIVDESCKELGIGSKELYYEQVRRKMLVPSENGYEDIREGGTTDFLKALDTYVFTAEEYKCLTGEDVELDTDQILILGGSAEEYAKGKVIILGNEYDIKGSLDKKKIEHIYQAEMALFPKLVLVVSEEAGKRFDQEDMGIHFATVAFDLEKGSSKDNVNALEWAVEAKGLGDVSFRNKAEFRAGFISIYGAILFVGVFLSVVFLIATVMIIYYKQMSEGFEDRRRFTILRNVGLTETEAKKTIKSQVMIMFFLPVGASIIHAIVASSLIRQFLSSILVVDTLTFGLSIAVSCIVFFLVYTFVYLMTSKQYYETVYGRSEAA